MDKLILSGLFGVFLGIDTFNEDDILLFRKPCILNDNINSINFFNKFNICLNIGFINFTPKSKINNLKQNNNQLRKLEIYKGSPIYDILLEKDYYLPINLKKHNKNIIYNYKYEELKIKKFITYLVSHEKVFNC